MYLGMRPPLVEGPRACTLVPAHTLSTAQKGPGADPPRGRPSRSAVLVADSARRPGARVEDGAGPVLQGRLVTGVVPDVPGLSPVAVGRGVRALAGVDPD